ncbi:MAG TPA: hypothetical protein DCZ10_01410 [Pelotomaculum sp.]|nr:hypothetical protein [Pelotomaculum sp.]
MKGIKQFLYLLRKDFKESIRTGGIIMFLLFPVALSFIFAYTLGGENFQPPKLVAYDRGSPDFVQFLREQEVFQVLDLQPESWEDARQAVKDGEAHAAVMVPEDFKRQINEGKRPEVTLVVDDTMPMQAILARETLERQLWVYSVETPPGHLNIITLKGLSVQQSMLPTWIVMGILSMIMFVSIGVAEEKENKTLNALLLASVDQKTLVSSKVTLGVFFIGVMVTVMMALNKGFIGNIPGSYLFVFMGAVVCAEMGLLIGVLAPDQATAGMYNTVLYMALLLGAVLAKAAGPVKRVIQTLPSYHILEGLEKMMLKGSFDSFPWPNAGVLGAYGLVLFALSVWALKKREV